MENDKLTFPIVEIFTSIQGEGCNLGKRANFIRFAGCNLNCPWCDTKWDKVNKEASIEDILRELDSRVDLVVLTGGEPMLQIYLPTLINRLVITGYQVSIETNGTKSTESIKEQWPRVWVTCSPKPQSSWSINPRCIYDELKFIVDGNFNEKHIPETRVPIWLQPEGGNMQEAWQEALKIQQQAETRELDIRIGVQLHKIMEVR